MAQSKVNKSADPADSKPVVEDHTDAPAADLTVAYETVRETLENGAILETYNDVKAG